MKTFINIDETKRNEYNKVVTHPLQSFEWGEFRKVTGIKVIRRALVENNKIIDGFTLTIHKIPYLPYFVGYLPKGNFPKKEILDEIQRIGKEEKCIFIQLEPDVTKFQISNFKYQISNYPRLRTAFHPLFTKYTFVLDLTKSEEELLAGMHPKTRYNMRLAQKKGVFIQEDNSEDAFNDYLKLVEETTTRQKFYAHTSEYHRLLWQTVCLNSNLKEKSTKVKEKVDGIDKNRLTYQLLSAKYKANDGNTYTLVSWVLFVFQDTLYYPYGASSSSFKEVMASSLIAWEAIRLGKRLNLKKFDMWGAMGPEPDTRDPWYGFHRFKQGYGGELTEFLGSFDLIINPLLYNFYKGADKTRWALLKLNKLRGNH